MRAVPRDAFEAVVARLDDDDLPVFAMLLDRAPYDSIAEDLRIDQAEVSQRGSASPVGCARGALSTSDDVFRVREANETS
jgi:hypothetical protein